FPVFLFVSGAAQLSNISQPVSFQTAKLGDSVTFECQIKRGDQENRVWYKVTAGRRLQLVVRENKLFNRNVFGPEFLQSSHRYSLKHDSNIYHLSISAATWEDIGTYYCGVLQLSFIEFGPGTFLMLKGILSKNFHDCEQFQPESESVQPGDSVTLSCSVHTGDCGDTSVFWLKSSESSGPEAIYNSGNQSESCERTESGSPQTSCVFKLPKQNLSSDDAGTYYCVVASCGETLFGNGTELHIKGKTLKLKISKDISLGVLYNDSDLNKLSVILYLPLCLSQPGDDVNYAAVSLASRSSSSRTAKAKHSADAVLYSEVRCRDQ
uniref:Novel immune-type receptor 8 n=1 Tax=Myripristis murdjan TaxID=586833 RepID=A0A667Z5D4_9TELE